jgi:hypothetical protein
MGTPVDGLQPEDLKDSRGLIGERLEINQKLVLPDAEDPAYRIAGLMHAILIDVPWLVASEAHFAHRFRYDLISRLMTGVTDEKLVDLVCQSCVATLDKTNVW